MKNQKLHADKQRNAKNRQDKIARMMSANTAKSHEEVIAVALFRQLVREMRVEFSNPPAQITPTVRLHANR
jgi:hypothetical protein